jgi:hypothetical protein
MDGSERKEKNERQQGAAERKRETMVWWERKKRTRATLQNKSSPLLIHQNLDYEQGNKIVK